MGTDWPVSLLASDYDRTVDLVRDAIAGLDEESQRAVLWTAAAEAYRLDEGRL
jgi:predicted TIM-barrel fold metal-dependent hydrolase